MRIALRGFQRAVPEKFLNLTQIRSPIEHVRGRTVAQSMRADVRNAGIPRMFVHHSSNHPLIDASAAITQKQRIGRS